MTAVDILRRVIGALDRAAIPYMLTGSFASSHHGTPRSTQDVDIVIAPTADQLRRLAAILPTADYHLDLDAALNALLRQGMFNIIDFGSGWKFDLIIRKSRPFSREEFDRRGTMEFHGLQVSMATAEDVLIAKLEWAKRGQSPRQIADAAGILRIRAGDLDRAYITRWVRDLDLEEQWRAACRAAGVLPEPAP